jgi:SAM-dependent methyltransferase
MSSWFESWFDTKYYHILYKNRDFAEAEKFINNLNIDLNINHDAKVLDLACGKGRHSVFLNKKGLNVTGVDLSKESIAHAKKYENNSLKFFVHDMRKPIDENSFDFVFNLFTSIGYFESDNDNLEMLNSIASYTNENGVLVIDFMNATKVVNDLVSYEEKLIEGITFKISKEVKDGFIVKTIEFVDNGQAYKFFEKVQVLTFDIFKNLFNQTNFKIYKIAGNYDLSEFDVEKSDRLIIFAKKI